MSGPYIVVYSRERGREELTHEGWYMFLVDRRSFHRIDGPAIIQNEHNSWYIDNVCHSEKNYNKLIQEIKDMPLVLRLIDSRWWVREFEE